MILRREQGLKHVRQVKGRIMAREMPNEDQIRKTPTHDEIAQRAYQVFLERGQPQGHDLDHWLEAEAQLKQGAQQQQQRQKPAATSRTRTSSRQTSRRA
jgi:hypothetical protein